MALQAAYGYNIKSKNLFCYNLDVQFLIIGHDGKGKNALERRLAVRQAHIDLGDKMEQLGNRWYGAVLLDDNGQMIGSMTIMDFPSEKDMQEWLDTEPYVTGNVWEKVEVHKCNVREPWHFNRPRKWFENRQNTQS